MADHSAPEKQKSAQKRTESGGAENAGLENARLENVGLENRLESDKLRLKQPQTSSTIDVSELS